MTAQGFDDDPDEEVLAGPRLPRWTMPALLVAAALGVAGLVAAQLVQGDPTQQAAPRSSAPRPSVSVSYPAVPPVDYLGTLGPGLTPVDVSALGPVLDLHTDGKTLWELQPETLFRQTSEDFSSTAIMAVPSGRLGSNARLVPDPEAGLMWVAVLNVEHPVLQAYKAQTLDRVAQLTWPRPISAVAALGGRLYVADDSGLSVVSTTGGPDVTTSRVAPLVATDILAMAADPQRGDVIMLADRPGGTQLLTVSGTKLDAKAGPPISTDAAIIVTDVGQVWAGGRGPTGPVLMRLDPDGNDYRMPARFAAHLLGASGTVLDGGAEDLIVGGANGAVCLRGTDGLPVQRWSAPVRRVSLAPAVAYATTSRGLVRLPFDGCTG